MRAGGSRGGSDHRAGSRFRSAIVAPTGGAVAAWIGSSGDPRRLGDVVGLGGRALMAGKGQDPQDRVD